MAKYYRTERVGFRSPPPPPPPIPTLGGEVGGGGSLLQQRLDQLGEAVARPVEAALDRPQVAPRDVGDLSVALPFQLPQHEHGAVVGGQLGHALIHRLLEVP